MANLESGLIRAPLGITLVSLLLQQRVGAAIEAQQHRYF
jgi:hypothetical protein